MRTRTKWESAVAQFAIVILLSILAGCGESRVFGSNQSPKPVVRISIEPTSLVRGSAATIFWSATDATECLAGGEWFGPRPASGSETFTPHISGKLSFTLSCTGAGGTAMSSAALTSFRAVSPP
jgi:hypothetical protein